MFNGINNCDGLDSSDLPMSLAHAMCYKNRVDLSHQMICAGGSESDRGLRERVRSRTLLYAEANNLWFNALPTEPSLSKSR